MIAKQGICHMCGSFGKLSYEHVPPRAAYNHEKAYIYGGLEIFGDDLPWDFSNKKGKQLQRGVGFYTLCERCNTSTGDWYAKEFINMIHQTAEQGYPQLQASNSPNVIHLVLRDIYPLRIIKQIITMFLSINSATLPEKHPDLRTFLLDKHKRSLSPTQYGFYTYYLAGTIIRYLGLSGLIDLEGTTTRLLSELSTPPLGFVFELKPKTLYSQYQDITFFANKYDYNEYTTLNLQIPVLQSNTPFPGDYRSKEEILRLI